MDKKELIKLLNKLNFPKDEYYILSSGCLLLYGLRDQASDLDLCISEDLFNQIKIKYNLIEENKNHCGFYPLQGENVEVVVDSKSEFCMEEKDGYNVQNLYKLLVDKKKRNLPKDQKDIENIEKYLEKNKIEYRDLYDQNKIATGKTFRRGKTVPNGYYMLTVISIIENLDGRYLIQKSSDKKGSDWASTGGHPKAGENSKQGIIQEIKEELGIDVSHEKMDLIETVKTKDDFIDLYYIKMNIDLNKIVIQKDEVQEVKLVTKNELQKMISDKNFRNSHMKMFEIFWNR